MYRVLKVNTLEVTNKQKMMGVTLFDAARHAIPSLFIICVPDGGMGLFRRQEWDNQNGTPCMAYHNMALRLIHYVTLLELHGDLCSLVALNSLTVSKAILVMWIIGVG
jgi:hypothetical protein